MARIDRPTCSVIRRDQCAQPGGGVAWLLAWVQGGWLMSGITTKPYSRDWDLNGAIGLCRSAER